MVTLSQSSIIQTLSYHLFLEKMNYLKARCTTRITDGKPVF